MEELKTDFVINCIDHVDRPVANNDSVHGRCAIQQHPPKGKGILASTKAEHRATAVVHRRTR